MNHLLQNSHDIYLHLYIMETIQRTAKKKMTSVKKVTIITATKTKDLIIKLTMIKIIA